MLPRPDLFFKFLILHAVPEPHPLKIRYKDTAETVPVFATVPLNRPSEPLGQPSSRPSRPWWVFNPTAELA
jgi:hypothetical protein